MANPTKKFSSHEAQAIAIISGTNRKDSKTLMVAHLYQRLLKNEGLESLLVNLEGLDLNKRSVAFEKMENDLLIPSTKFIFILPEYNGSFSGAVKVMIDMSRIKECWWNKKALLTGVAEGRAGNLRGMEHFTGVLNFLKILVHHNKLPISMINQVMNAKGEITDRPTDEAIKNQIDEFIIF
ncbi:MAG: NADPH-dependent FMN reductase [Chitinophagaceae bacterium]